MGGPRSMLRAFHAASLCALTAGCGEEGGAPRAPTTWSEAPTTPQTWPTTTCAPAASAAPDGRAPSAVALVGALAAELHKEPALQYDAFGVSVAGAGDLDGDGFADLAIAATQGYDETRAGEVYLYAGGSADPGPAPAEVLAASDGRISDFLGASLDGAGDVNADGCDDLIAASRDGAYVWLGGAWGTLGNAEQQLVVPERGAEGSLHSVAGVGDADGDGFDDVAVLRSWLTPGGEDRAAVYLYLGEARGITAASASTLTGVIADGGYRNLGDDPLLAGVDLDADGVSELVTCAEAGAGPVVHTLSPDGAAADVLRLEGPACETVAPAGDTDGDGYADFLVGDTNAYVAACESGYIADRGVSGGVAWLLLGSSTGVDLGAGTRIVAADCQPRDDFGRSVASAGDVDGDGLGDIVVSAANWSDEFQWEPGTAHVFLGAPGGVDLSTEVVLAPPDGEAWDAFGWSLDGADLDGDGRSEVVVGMPGDGAWEGAAFVFGFGP